ncbi:hypothetical protein J4G43_021700 [Bradyrhizobium barranii subsp. barranii]|uniref:Uncharacterized protein n=1 Tax=Bradyrhizobium barranii subsp. barranii TaxID=2823807 RepID=A0A939M6L2_9BRAD|nr:hypothetical protein [Bradyrhizobium barranii]UEM16594.1 hypothetical protein J4G43_021700 [Bradyrhizobium barranii subsp. barranii]
MKVFLSVFLAIMAALFVAKLLDDPPDTQTTNGPAPRSVRPARHLASPNFRVRVRKSNMGGASFLVRILDVQSANDDPVLVKTVSINENKDCTENPNKTLALGETITLLAEFCDPIKVRIVTDRGEVTYHFD